MSGFGEYDSGGGASNVVMRTAIYRLRVEQADVKRDSSGQPVRKDGKVRFGLRTTVVGSNYAGEIVKRTMSISYNANDSGNFGPFPSFIQAVTGIRCGDDRQRTVGRAELEGREFDAMIKHERGYNNIIDFIAPEAQPARAPVAQRQEPPPQERAATGPIAVIGAGHLRHIHALQKAFKITDTVVADLVELVTSHRTRHVAGVAQGPEFEDLLARLKARKVA
ncbi:MAG TPA: hypothetical protein VGP41_08525 [Candidatus Lustribacter sp.]|nr:hypothetical protein [Candidatus Lustribacter sp.]